MSITEMNDRDKWIASIAFAAGQSGEYDTVEYWLNCVVEGAKIKYAINHEIEKAALAEPEWRSADGR